MKTRNICSLFVSIAVPIALASPRTARADELEELKATMQSMQKTMEQLQQYNSKSDTFLI